MKNSRQDAWTNEEDVILQQIVLSHIKTGYTQMSAFALASEKLNRTPAACGFRWNAFLRKQLSDEVKQAKKQRMEHNEEGELDIIHHIIEQLQKLKHVDKETTAIGAYERLQEENTFLRRQINRYEETWTKMSQLWTETDSSYKDSNKEV